MKAVLLHAYGGIEQLSYEEVPDPRPAAGEVVVEMIGTSVNPIDYKVRRGAMKDIMPLKLPAILGRDLVGKVVALGPGVTSLKAGDIVLGLVNNGYAELVACKARDMAVLPAGLDPVDAAGLPLVLLTGSQLIESGVQPQRGQTVLVTGALGGVGRTAVHVAKQHGAHVIAGVRRSQFAQAAELSADSVVAIDEVAVAKGLPELDSIADTVGGETIDRLISRIKKGGQLASVVGQPRAESPDLRIVPVYAKPNPVRLAELALDVQRGQFTIPIAARFKLSQIREAHALAENAPNGKVILTP